MARILVIDDDQSLRKVVTFILGEAGHEVIGAADGEEGIRLFDSEDPDLTLTDMRMPGKTGLEVLKHIQDSERAPAAPVIVLTAYGTVEQAVEAMKLGAFTYLLKPFGRDDLKLTVDQALHTRHLESDNANLRRLLRQRSTGHALVYDSEIMARLLEQIRQTAATDASILITGESGTGKELVARAVHDLSPRWDKPFVPVNCGAIPSELMESELFGHAKGAFTGAHKSALGKFRSADGGTLFLDEIGEMPASLQPKLLRVLETRSVDPVGETRSVAADFRLVSATNSDLASAIGQGRFREDLFYRIETVHLHVPPLRERRDDIPVLWDHFTSLHAGKHLKSSESLVKRLLERDWPGNVRQLKNMNQRLIMMSQGDGLTATDFDRAIEMMGPGYAGQRRLSVGSVDEELQDSLYPVPLPDDGLALPDLEKEIVSRAIAKFNGNKSRAAVYLGIPRHVLIYRIQKYDIGG